MTKESLLRARSAPGHPSTVAPSSVGQSLPGRSPAGPTPSRRRFVAAVAAVALAAAGLSLVGCKKGGDPAATGGDAGGTGEIAVGHYGSISGNDASFGTSTDNGIKLAVKEFNAKGGLNGRKVKLITYDDAGKTEEVVNSVNRFIKQDKVVAVLGEVASSRSKVGGAICQKAGVPMITPSSTNPDVTKIGNMVSRVCFIDPYQGPVGARFVKDKLGLTKGAVLYNRAQDYSTGLKDGFVSGFQAAGGTLTVQSAYNDGDNDYSAQLAAIKATAPQFVYIPGYYSEVVAIAKQARRLGLNVPLVGGDGWVSEDLKNAGDALDNCYFTDHYAQEEARPEVQEFVKKFQADNGGKAPDSMAALGYDAANVLFDAMGRAKSLNGDDLAAAINATKGFKAVTGTITLDANRDAQKGVVVQKVMGGKFSLFWSEAMAAK
jgi:branched-chain amino acid transport system substrate-binding protein